MRGCAGFDTLGLGRDSVTALSRGGSGDRGPGVPCCGLLTSDSCSAGLGVWVGTLALSALRAHLCGAP